MVARRKLFTYQVTYSIPGISSSKITQKTSGGRHKSSYNIERFRGPPFLLLLQNYIKLLIFVVSSFCPMIPLSPLVQILHPPILLTPFLSEDMNYKRDQGLLLKEYKIFLITTCNLKDFEIYILHYFLDMPISAGMRFGEQVFTTPRGREQLQNDERR